MTISRADLDRDLEAEAAQVVALVRQLGAAGWAAPTPAPGWSICDQVSHLAFFDDQAVLAAVDPQRFRKDRDAELADIEGFTARVAQRYRDRTGPELLEWLVAARERLIVSTAGTELSTRVPWYGPDMSPASSLTARIMETWAHGQDIADALGITRVPGPALRSVADLGVRAFPNSFRAHGRPVPDVTVRVELTSPDGEAWHWGDEPAADVLRGPALDFCLLVTQRRHPADLALEAEGPVAHEWLAVAQAFAGPPGAKRLPTPVGMGR